jgi:hypothetical protein
MNNERLQVIMRDLAACGVLENLVLTLGSGFFRFMLPRWVHTTIVFIKSSLILSYAKEIEFVIEHLRQGNIAFDGTEFFVLTKQQKERLIKNEHEA